MQSLLGLTDVKLKQELSALVDTSLWVAAGQDVRARERSIKTRLTELSVEARLRREELARADAAFTDANNTLNARQVDLELAQQRVSDIPVLNVSISDLTEMLFALQCTQEIFVRDTLDPLKNAVAAAVQLRETESTVLDKRINQLRLEVTKVKTEKNATLAATSALEKKKDQVQTEEDALVKKIAIFQANITAALSTITGSISDVADGPALRQLYEQALVDLTAVNMRIDTANTSLVRLNELNRTSNAHACGTNGTKISTRLTPVAPLEGKSNEKDEECPTCGQEMPLESRANRTRELTASLEVLRGEKEALTKRSSGLRKLYDNSTSLKTASDQKNALQDRIREICVDITAHTTTLTTKSEGLIELERDLKQLESEKIALLESFNKQESERLQEQNAAAAHLATLQAKEATLRKQIDNSRLQQEQQNSLQRSVHAQLALAQDRVTNALSALQERSAAQLRIQEFLAQNAAVSEDLTSQGLVLERLADDLEEQHALRAKLIGAALYPAIVSLVAIVIVLFLVTYVVPQVANVFAGSKRALPLLTVIMINTSAFLRSYGWLLALALAAGVFGLRLALANAPFREQFDAAWLKLPILGKMSRSYNSARFASTLAMLASAGVPILKALQAAAQTLSNRAMRSDALDALVLVREGAPLASALAQKKRFPGLLAMFARLGEQTGTLPLMLQRAAKQLGTEVQRRALQLATLLEPLLIVAMGLMVMLIVLAVLMPIIQLNQLVR